MFQYAKVNINIQIIKFFVTFLYVACKNVLLLQEYSVIIKKRLMSGHPMTNAWSPDDQALVMP